MTGGAFGANPTSGTLSLSSSVSWTGGPFAASNPVGCDGEGDATCDNFSLIVDRPDTGNYKVEITVSTGSVRDDFDVYVYDEQGEIVDDGASSGTPPERLVFAVADDGTYRVEVLPWLVKPGATYQAQAVLKRVASTAGSPDPNSVLWGYDPAAAEATVDAPLRVVLVGFEKNEFDAATLTGGIPDSQRPGVLIPRYDAEAGGESRCSPVLGGNWTLINHGRCYYDDAPPFLVPWQFNWKPQLVYAPDAFADGLFATMAANSETGEISGRTYREHLERYNATRGVYRGLDKQVAPNAPIRFVDAEAVEDWIATNALEHLGFEIGARSLTNPGLKPGYTVFVLNTWDSPQAIEHLKPEHEYHVFKVERIDPDTGEDEGVDWARVWGGRYREMIMDLGAAPNPYESETWGNNGEAIFGSESFDPPLWEYRASAPRAITPGELPDADRFDSAISPGRTWTAGDLAFNIGRFANEAASYRFAHSYLYEPRPQTGQYYLSSNIWHDAKSQRPWPSDLTKLYNEDAVMRGLRTLVPYFTFAGDTQFKDLAEGDPDQAMLDQAKLEGDDIAGAPGTAMYTVRAMDYFDGNRDRFYRGGSCFTTVPNLNVVVEKHYAWALPVIVAGIATNRSGVPWGFLASVSDLTKWNGADEDPVLKAAHPQAFAGTFSYTAIHELSHYLGLAHPHDTVGASKINGKTVYWDGFTWTFNTTAAPTTYSHDELVYSILDQENIARGHMAYYLRWANEAMAEAGEAWAEQGKDTIDKLSKLNAAYRSKVIKHMALARKEFGKFRFVPATFAAQRAWRYAAIYRDRALGLAPGTTEAQQGTKTADASACASATIR